MNPLEIGEIVAMILSYLNLRDFCSTWEALYGVRVDASNILSILNDIRLINVNTLVSDSYSDFCEFSHFVHGDSIMFDNVAERLEMYDISSTTYKRYALDFIESGLVGYLQNIFKCIKFDRTCESVIEGCTYARENPSHIVLAKVLTHVDMRVILSLRQNFNNVVFIDYVNRSEGYITIQRGVVGLYHITHSSR